MIINNNHFLFFPWSFCPKVEAEGTRWASGSQKCPRHARVLNRQTPWCGGGCGVRERLWTSSHWGSLLWGDPDAGGNCSFRELRSLWWEAWKILKSQTQIPADFQKKGKNESAEVESTHGEALLISFSDWWREVNKEEMSLCQLSYTWANHWIPLQKMSVQMCFKMFTRGKDKVLLIRSPCLKYSISNRQVRCQRNQI